MTDQRTDFRSRLTRLSEREIVEPGMDPRVRKAAMRAALYPLTYLLAIFLGIVFTFLMPLILLGSPGGGGATVLGMDPVIEADPYMAFRLITVTTFGASMVVLAMFRAMTVYHLLFVGVGVGIARSIALALVAGY